MKTRRSTTRFGREKATRAAPPAHPAAPRPSGTVTALGWIFLNGGIALAISIVAGGLIALRSTMGDDAKDPATDDT